MSVATKVFYTVLLLGFSALPYQAPNNESWLSTRFSLLCFVAVATRFTCDHGSAVSLSVEGTRRLFSAK